MWGDGKDALPVVALLVAGWYIANAGAAFYTKAVFREVVGNFNIDPTFADRLLLCLCVTTVQLAVTGVAGKVQNAMCGSAAACPWRYLRNMYHEDRKTAYHLALVAGCNAVGTATTNIGYIYGSVSLVQVLKSMEPAMTYLCDVLILGSPHDPTALMGVGLVIAGACYASFNDTSFNAMSVSAALTSNVVLPVRNIIIKKVFGSGAPAPPVLPSPQVSPSVKESPGDNRKPNGFAMFALISSMGAVLTAVTCAALMTTTVMQPIPQQSTFLAASGYAAYNSFSFMVLGHMSPVLHALLNVFKRAFTIVVNIQLTNTPPTMEFLIGLCISIIGLTIYVKAKKKSPITTKDVMRGLVFVLVSLVLADLVTGGKRTKTVAQYIPVVRSPKLGHKYVPFDAWGACDGRVEQLSCERTVVAKSAGALQQGDDMSGVCAAVLAGAGAADEGEAQLVNGDVGVCLQIGDVVGVVVGADGVGVAAGDAQSVAAQVGTDAEVVPRIVMAMNVVYRPPSPKHDLKRSKDPNLGNFVWEYGAARVIDPYTTKIVQASACGKGSEVQALVIASANALYLRKPELVAGHIQAYTTHVRNCAAPSAVFGIGIQAEFKDEEWLKTAGLPDKQHKLMELLESRMEGKAIGVRGQVTEQALLNSGITKSSPLGCPSLTIARDPNLAATMARRWRATREKLEAGKRIRLVLTLPALHTPEMKERFAPVLKVFPTLYEQHDTRFVLQTPQDRAWTKKYTQIDQNHVLTFNDTDSWTKYMEGVDLVFSTRIHGTMAAIGGGAPAFVVPTDFRIQELVDAMRIPYLPMEEAVKPFSSLQETMSRVVRDYGVFEKNRRSKIAEYKSILAGMGARLHPQLETVLQAPLEIPPPDLPS
eukprot:TRINITY_DN180_c0_g1_i3.p1 TRINITY_DN180_c0_g1~~TRINITY_DN180_c0_g1_i3.p1  ORF type:complete len:874 (+),score=166.92 TRINITY_DN180_c0_g1_i3:437-3058(+)